MPLLKPPLCLHEGRLLVPLVVVGEVGVSGRPCCGGCSAGGCGGGCGCCGGSCGGAGGCGGGGGGFILREVDCNLDITKSVLNIHSNTSS